MSMLSQTWMVNDIQSPLEFSALKPVWDELLACQPDGSVFWCHDYVRAWREAFGQNLDWHILTVAESQQIHGIFPLTCASRNYYGAPIRQMGFFHNHHVLRSNAILRPGSEKKCFRAILAYLIQHRRDWAVLLLDNIPESSPLFQVAVSVANEIDYKITAWKPSRNHCFLPIAGTWEDYLAQRSGNFRWQIKKFQRRLQQLGTVRIEHLSDRDQMLKVLPEIFRLEQRSWQGQESGSAMHDSDRRFQELLLRYLPDECRGEYWLLYLNNELVASITTLRYRELLYVFTTYYAPEHASAAPGMVLYFEMLKSAWHSDLKGIDFNGDSHAFRRWTPISQPHYRLHIYSNSYTGGLIRFSKRLRDHVREKIA